MDLATISQELNKRFLAPLPEFYKRRIIVWYDEEKEFEDQIGELELQDAKVLCVTGNNYFEIKKTLAVDEPNQNFLLYNPMNYEKPEDNWLIDVELYSEEFRADLIAIWMDEYGAQMAAYSGGLGFFDMCDAQNASEQQLLEMAKREGFNLYKYRK